MNQSTAAPAPDNVRTHSADPSVPGAFKPDDKEPLSSGFDAINRRVSDAATSVGETAKQYLPQAAQYLPKSVVDTVQGPRPKSPPPPSTHIPHRTSLPSTEITGAAAGEHVAGVGSLPGTIGESGVARLPDEVPTPYNEPASVGTTTPAATTTAAAATGIVGGAVESANQQRNPTPQTSLPSTESTGAPPSTHSAGVGALPGNTSESAVARLPDEHTNVDTSRQAADSHAPGGTTNTVPVAATRARVGSVGAGILATESADRENRLPGGMNNRTGGDLGTAQSQARPVAASTLSSDSQYSQSSFQGSHSDATNKATAGGVGTSGAATGALLAGGGFGGREPAPAQPSQSVGDSQKSAMESRGTHTDTANVQIPPVAATKTKSEDEAKETSGTGKETQMTSGGETKKEEHQTGHENKGSDWVSDAGTPGDELSASEKARAHAREVLRVRAMDGPEREETLRRDAPLRERMGMGDPGLPRGHGPSSDGEMQGDMRHADTKARVHGLGREGAMWGGVNVGGEGYRAQGKSGSEDGDGYGSDYHPAQLHPAGSEAHAQSTEDAARAKSSEDKAREPPSEKSNESAGSGGPSSTPSKRKVGFMEKMKGEAKVLLGHLEGGKKGDEKVEEGKRIKSGLPAVPKDAKA
ncbi:hypothetical protein EUX98_g8021 [Antrodiella citrinella]|uniref:Uncharacterized protein n=1 Tax=Antrodiella citrinella TaxID=2447956 RepID=A0A4S4MCD6_9APHY|nr:hypothetical protein EUX98_g8021 [Antrodiella citrinella]